MKLLFTSFLIAVALSSCSKYELTELNTSQVEISSDNRLLAATNIQSASENELLTLVNGYRISINKDTLSFNDVVYYYASEHTKYMISEGQISHAKFGNRAEKISKKVGAKFVAENVAKEYPDMDLAFEGWLESPAHRKNIEGDYTHTAISVIRNKNGKFYFTQMFSK